MLQATHLAGHAFSGIRITSALTRVRAVARRVLCTRRDTAKYVGFSVLLDSHHRDLKHNTWDNHSHTPRK